MRPLSLVQHSEVEGGDSSDTCLSGYLHVLG